jgi:winged helix DNA-binding protein
VAARRPRVVTTRALNRALLARQGLLERHPPGIARALERAGGIQAQYAPSMYTGVWSRMEGLERAALTRALERGTVVQATLMRSTIHLVSARDFWPFADGVRRSRREWWRRVTTDRPSDAAMRAAAERLREAFASADGGVLRRAEIEALLGKPVARAIGMWIDLVRAPPSGTWERRRADLYGLAEAWVERPDITKPQALEHLARRYLGAFGPATAADVANWAGLKPAALAPALKRLELRRFHAEDGAELLDLPRAPLPAADTPAPVRFLPTWDATLLVHARRTGILPEQHRPKIFHTKNPQSLPTFLVDGEVAGTWRHEGGKVLLEPFGRLDTATRRALDAEAEGLAPFHA